MPPYEPPSLSSREQIRAGRLTLRIAQLTVGMALCGLTMAMLIRSELGLDPWDVFHQGLANHLPLSFGQVVIATGVVVLLLWIPLKQWPGLGTVLNVVAIGLVADWGLSLFDSPDQLWLRMLLLAGGIVGNGLAVALYIGPHLGPGPRDGLWLGLVRRTGLSIGFLRTSVELSVLVVGFALGGTVGFGTVLYAVSIGPIVQFFLPLVQVDLSPRPASPAE